MSAEQLLRRTLRPPPEAARDWSQPGGKLRAELYCLALTFLPHARNSYKRKAVTVALVLGWVYLTWRQLAHQPVPTEAYGPLSALVWIIVGRFYGIEIDKFAALADSDWSLTIQGGSPETRGDDAPPESPDEAIPDDAAIAGASTADSHHPDSDTTMTDTHDDTETER